MDEKFTNPSPTLFQAGFWPLLPGFLGWTFLLLCGLALLALGWLLDRIFQTSWCAIVALVVPLSLMPHWLSSLTALLIPSRRRLLVDQSGYICKLGLETRRADWSTCGDIATTHPVVGKRSIQFTGKVSRVPRLWPVLVWPSRLVLWVIGLIAALATAMASDTHMLAYFDDLGSDDPTRIPAVFLRGDAASPLEAALRRYPAAAQVAA